MPGIENYTGFVLAAIILNLTPGQDTFYILTRCISQGKAAGMASVAGIITGCIVHVTATALGLSVILTTSPTLFDIVKWSGALYLILMGVKALLDKETGFGDREKTACSSPLVKIYRQGIWTNVLNPKVALFFLSLLPQFIDPESTAGPLPFLVLGTTYLMIGAVWFSALAGMAALVTRILRRNRQIRLILNRVSGIIFIGFGLGLALNTA